MQEALDELAQKWDMPAEITEIHLGKRDDLTEKIVKVGEVFFHMPFLTKPKLYVLWKCLWPDCHNCCEKPVRIPMTENDIDLMRKKFGYKTSSDFIKNETTVITFQDKTINDVLITHSMLSMKRKKDETPETEVKKGAGYFHYKITLETNDNKHTVETTDLSMTPKFETLVNFFIRQGISK